MDPIGQVNVINAWKEEYDGKVKNYGTLLSLMRCDASLCMLILLFGCGSEREHPDQVAGAGGTSGQPASGAAGNIGGNSGHSGTGAAAGSGGTSGAVATGGKGGGIPSGGSAGSGRPPVGSPDHRIAAGSGISCAISDANEVVCWGVEGGTWVSHPALRGTYRSIAIGLDGANQAVCATDASGNAECIQWNGEPGGTAGMVLSEDCLPTAPIGAFVLDRKNPGNFGYLDMSGLAKWFPLNVACPEQSAPSSVAAAKRIAVAGDHACVVNDDAAIECWNLNLSSASEPSVSDTYVDVAVSSIVACGVTQAGKLRCWDYMGIEDVSSSSLPGQVNALGLSVVAVASDNSGGNLCALLADGRAVCALDFNNNVTSTDLAPNDRWLELAVGDDHVCGVRSDRSVGCVPFGCRDCQSDIAPPMNLRVIAR